MLYTSGKQLMMMMETCNVMTLNNFIRNIGALSAVRVRVILLPMLSKLSNLFRPFLDEKVER